MKKIISRLIIFIKVPVDLTLTPIIVLPGFIMWFFRRVGSARLPLSSWVLKTIGVWVIRDHYYEPLFNAKHLNSSLKEPRDLPGVDLNEARQLEFLNALVFAEEFTQFVSNEKVSGNPDSFKIDNDSFGTGDSDFLYQFIRSVKPGKVFEIGSGNSTKIAQRALSLNKSADGKESRHISLEPYEQPWLDRYEGIELVREKVESCNIRWEDELDSGDLLFIDSSHMIRPQGDVLYEYLNILPRLKRGVFVHVHDVFTPRDYLEEWVKNDVLFWNEQYILEALLSNSERYEIIASLNHLKHSHYEALSAVCPFLTRTREPGSFYFRIS